jgi:ATP-dependent exoDNAse (exonuclease V) beta subunit
MSAVALSEQQRVAVEARGEVVVAAGAGTGKTTLVIERVRSALELGTAPERVLVVTYTEAAARELALRLERALPAGTGAPRPQVGTIHALAARLLREYASEAGLPAELRVLDEAEALVLSETAFGDAIARERRDGDSVVLDLLGEYGVDGSRALIRSLDARLRAAGAAAPQLPPQAGPSLLAPLREAAERASAALTGDDRPQAASDLRRLARIDTPLAGTPGDRELLALAAPKSEAAGEVAELLATAQLEARARLEHEVGVAVATLLTHYREAYRARKETELALDFDDLQERACELLERPEIGGEVRERFDLVLVDEFQDTNGLQCRLLDALVGPDCQRVFVGDACQSIYRFRYADVELFRARGEAAALRLPLTGSYRSRPELLAVIGHVFGQRFDERDFESPHALRTVEPITEPAIELHLVASGEGSARAAPAREVEANALARRLRELVAGGVLPGGIAVLLRSARDASTYAAALERVGLVARSQLGRGFYRSQQVRDLCAYLALLRNRFDDHALLVVLASPLVGVSNDGLSALRGAAQRALYWPIELGQLEGLPERDRALVERFKELYDGLVRASGELGLAALLERIVAEHDYDLACLTAPDGERRFGNARKLVRTARSYERDRGPDLAGFVEQMRLCDARDLSEADAPPGGGEEAVALMTIHAAKGLEFPVVCVPDLSRSTPAETGAVAVGPDGEVGLRLRDARGKLLDGPVYARLAASGKAAEEAEGDRVAYVAWTRARDRLLLGGWLGGGRRGELQRALGQLGIVGAALEPGLTDVDVAGTQVRVHVHTADDAQSAAAVPAPPAEEPELPPEGQLSLFDIAPVVAPSADRPVLPEPLAALPATAVHVPRSLSYSALALHDRCGFSYYAERVVGLRSPRAADGPLQGALLGDAVHRAVAVGVERASADLGADERAIVANLVAAWERSSLSARMRAAGTVAHELPFAFCEDDVVLRGSLDICVRDAEGALLVADLKTTALGGREPAAVVESEYALQRAIYALAALRTRAPACEIAFCFLERPEETVSRAYAQTDAGWLADEVRAAIARLRSSTFTARAGAHCATCPALDRLCPAPGWRE